MKNKTRKRRFNGRRYLMTKKGVKFNQIFTTRHVYLNQIQGLPEELVEFLKSNEPRLTSKGRKRILINALESYIEYLDGKIMSIWHSPKSRCIFEGTMSFEKFSEKNKLDGYERRKKQLKILLERCSKEKIDFIVLRDFYDQTNPFENAHSR